MNKKMSVGLLLAAALAAGLVWNARDVKARGNSPGPIIYVWGQGLFYDSVLAADPLPPKGPFQLLEKGGPSPSGLQTQFGPGDPEYLGGRWLEEGTEHYFSCPLLGPGRENP